MSRLTTFFLGMVAGAAALYISENYYIVRSNESFHLVPKVAAKLEIPYRDIRQYSTDDWKSDPSLALAIVNSKKENLLIDSGLSNMRAQLEGMLRSLSGQ